MCLPRLPLAGRGEGVSSMSAIDRVKELLAAAETECIGAVPCRRCNARMKLEATSFLAAQALVESQEALVLGLCTCDYLQDTCPLHSEYIERQIKESWTNEKAIQQVTAARSAVRLDGLAEVMER